MRNAVYDSAEMTAASRGLSDDKPPDIGDQRETFYVTLGVPHTQ